MTSSLRERRRQILHEEILVAASELLAQKGYATMSMDDLASHVGISKPTLYSYFGTKDQIVIATIVREIGRLAQLLESPLDEQSPLERLLMVLRKILQLHMEKDNTTSMALRPMSPELWQVLCAHPDAIACLGRLDSAIATLVQAAISAGEINAMLDPPSVVRVFYSMISIFRLNPISRMLPTPVIHPDTIVTIFANGVAAASSGS